MTPVLLIEDVPSMQLVYQSVLQSAGHHVESASTAADGLRQFRQHRPGVVLVDLMLPDRDGLELIEEFIAADPFTHVIVITANGSINRAVEAMRAGAWEFLVKPFDEARLLDAVSGAVTDHARAAGQRSPGGPMPDPIAVLPAPETTGLIGTSTAMREVMHKIGSVSRSMATVFISGESGTGKELCARALHDLSSRASGPFIALNCGAIPGDLLESEVFGHLKGSFTGALADKPGAAAAADGGTLFLDEICEMDLGLQTKLLRFLQTSTIQPVGSTKPRKVSVRILCATNRDPLAEVKAGRFREDLYYRLHVVPLHLPPLRERGRDVVEIARHALAEFAAEEGKGFTSLSPEVEDLFCALSWPGNVRQLLNVLRNVAVLHDGTEVTLPMLPMELHHEVEARAEAARLNQSAAAHPSLSQPAEPVEGLDGLIGKSMAEIERLVIEETIARNEGSVPRAARILGLSPSTIYRKRESWENPG
ncbi:sigma-54-dependent transcriptional regulator [Vannielia litorea]|uniref:Nif-specific regulatory protein n=1 Tax=Vannielia litorea TaxID=1217970 RepID=A0A1N6GYH7_9RHOB|nr:sigma-54 dependent transcriptional regulator [Vannielia litorea]SIO12569.1 two component, sigma54 specific, transcriptional regulator, Fis family [Vannielia litorea]